ncbi:MAG: DNA polymerase IV [Archaeoglobaceae archaeon]
MDRIILHVDLDSFYASVEELRNEEIKGKPIVVCVYSGRSEDSGAVSTANYKSRELGIKAGISIKRAKSLAKGHDVVFLPVDMEYYKEVSQRIMEILEKESDTVQQVSVDEAYLDITGRADDWKEAQKVGKRIKDRIKEREGITCSVGISFNKFMAKMASEHRKPDGMTTVKTQEAKEFLARMPLTKLHGIGKKTAGILNDMGIETVDDLARYSLVKLEEKLGKNKALMLHERAQGIDNSPVEPTTAQQVSRIGTLKQNTRDTRLIMEKLNELIGDMRDKVEQKKVFFRTVSLIVIDTHLKTHTRSETVQQTGDTTRAQEVIEQLLEDFLAENPGIEIRRAGVRLSNLTYRKEQKTLSEF